MNKTFTNRILGIDVAVTNLEDAAQLIRDQKDEFEGQYIALVSVDDLVAAQNDENIKEYIANAAMVLPASEPIAWIQRLRGYYQRTKDCCPPSCWSSLSP